MNEVVTANAMGIGSEGRGESIGGAEGRASEGKKAESGESSEMPESRKQKAVNGS
jgi:hypothetical protein